MRDRTLALLAIAWLMLMSFGIGRASAEEQRLIQRQHLVAESTAKTWTSREFGSATYAFSIMRDGHELREYWTGPCSATYIGKGLLVRVRVTSCNADSGRYRFRYVSISGRKGLTIQFWRVVG